MSILYAVSDISFNPLKTETPKQVTGKQCGRRSDVAECGVWSGYLLFANIFFYRNISIIQPDIPKIENGLFQYIVWGSLFSPYWVN